jgi:hypothetical protein
MNHGKYIFSNNPRRFRDLGGLAPCSTDLEGTQVYDSATVVYDPRSVKADKILTEQGFSSINYKFTYCHLGPGSLRWPPRYLV